MEKQVLQIWGGRERGQKLEKERLRGAVGWRSGPQTSFQRSQVVVHYAMPEPLPIHCKYLEGGAVRQMRFFDKDAAAKLLLIPPWHPPNRYQQAVWRGQPVQADGWRKFSQKANSLSLVCWTLRRAES